MLEIFLVIFLLVKLGAGAGWWILFMFLVIVGLTMAIITR